MRLTLAILTLFLVAGGARAGAPRPFLEEALRSCLEPAQVQALGADRSAERLVSAMSPGQKDRAKAKLVELEKTTKDPARLADIAEGRRLLNVPASSPVAVPGEPKPEVAKQLREHQARAQAGFARAKDPFDQKGATDGSPGSSVAPARGARTASDLPVEPPVPAKYTRTAPVPAVTVADHPAPDKGGRPGLPPLAVGLVGAAALAAAAKKKEPAETDWKSIAKSAAIGVGMGVVTAVAVTGLAVGAAALGVPAIVVTGALGVAAVVGGVYTVFKTVDQYQKKDWNGLAFTGGAILGGILVGAAGGGRLIADKVSPTPSSVPKSMNPFGDWAWRYNPNYPGGSFKGWLGSGPTPQSGGGTAAMTGTGLSEWLRPSATR